MVEMDSIRELAEKIVHIYRPQQVILFGSYAYGTPTADSDVDLLVIMPARDPRTRESFRNQGEKRAPPPRSFGRAALRTPAVGDAQQIRRRIVGGVEHGDGRRVPPEGRPRGTR